MTKKYNQALPFIVLAIVALTFIAEVAFEVEIDIGDLVPVLTAIGVGGAAIKVAEKARAAKASIPKDLENKIQFEINEYFRKKE